MGLIELHGPSASSSAPPPPWWTVDGAEVPFDSLENADLPDESEFLKKLIRAQAKAYREQKELNETLRQQLEAQLRHRFGNDEDIVTTSRTGLTPIRTAVTRPP